jgi:hypothetical protein
VHDACRRASTEGAPDGVLGCQAADARQDRAPRTGTPNPARPLRTLRPVPDLPGPNWQEAALGVLAERFPVPSVADGASADLLLQVHVPGCELSPKPTAFRNSNARTRWDIGDYGRHTTTWLARRAAAAGSGVGRRSLGYRLPGRTRYRPSKRTP